MAKKTSRRSRRNAGFTLIELMVVVTIIAALAVIAGVNLFGAVDTADRAKAQAEIKSLKSAVTMYMLKNNRKLPNSLSEVADFMDPPKIPLDPWGKEYVYQKVDSRVFKIISYAKDGAAGGDKDNADITSDD